VLVAGCVVPAAPLLVPDVASGAAAELDGCRSAIRSAFAQLRAAPLDELVVVGAGGSTSRHDSGASGTLASVGVPVFASVGRARDEPAVLPVPITIGCWLLEHLGGPTASWALEVDSAATAKECLDLGAALAASTTRTGLVVVADGTARRGERAPGYTDPRAAPFDEQWLSALRQVDPAALAGLDRDQAAALLMQGRASLQVLAGAAQSSGSGYRGDLLWAAVPYGVQYAVATWIPDGD
jgi:hypothetical protein